MSSRARLRKRDNFDPGQLQVLGPEVEIRLSSSSAQLEAEVCYDFKSNQYQTLPAGDFLINLLTLPSRVIHREDLELQTLARETAQGQGIRALFRSKCSICHIISNSNKTVQQHEPQDVSHELEELYGSIMSAEQLAKLDSQPNPFNFSERVSQTLRIPRKTVGQQTDQPPSSTFGASVGLSVIYDAYQHDYVLVLARERLRQADKDKDDDREKKSGKKSSWVTPHTAAAASTTPPHTDSAEEGGGLGRILRPTRIMERMVNQNIYDDIIHDYKYWEDTSDDFRPLEGSLLPLWKFTTHKTRDLLVADVCWSPAYPDLLAAAYTPSESCLYHNSIPRPTGCCLHPK
ncbi:dynein intermediate chain 2, ciliary [Procambarus clarkii]|uniref:dynein intermediate chain 2, ciliary n=1 Tax=Procambarus clarkii TaxID=6728 RepID=UPI0037434F4A